MTKRKRLTRSRSNWYMSGLCGGLAAYLGVAPMIVRAVLAAVVILTGMLGLWALIYLVLWFVVAAEGSSAASADETAREGIAEIGGKVKDAVTAAKTTGSQRSKPWMVGLLLAVVGVVLLAKEMGISLFTVLETPLRPPLALLVIGAMIMSAGRVDSPEEAAASAPSEPESGEFEGEVEVEEEEEEEEEEPPSPEAG